MMRRIHDVYHTPFVLNGSFNDIKLGGDAIENDLDSIIFKFLPPNMRWIQNVQQSIWDYQILFAYVFRK
jgi:hypothetical protein